jgi:hypothetical protein
MDKKMLKMNETIRFSYVRLRERVCKLRWLLILIIVAYDKALISTDPILPTHKCFKCGGVRTPLGWMAVLRGGNSSYNISGMYEFITPVTGGLKDLPL